MTSLSPEEVKLIAFYLPQFHPVPENDAWWGKGFTEWRNVAKAKPKFPGHYQPHLPADLGFYDLRLPEVRQEQANLALRYGIHGFCYYHYWFNGRRILERPFNEVLATGEPRLPFCLCWANENWTRRWDGADQEVLLEQVYEPADYAKHIRSLFPAFEDPRYIRIHGKPLFLVYKTDVLPEPERVADIWRSEAAKAGIGELYLVRVESMSKIDPQQIGFDAAVEFAPDWETLGPPKYRRMRHDYLRKLGLLPRYYGHDRIWDYEALVQGLLNKAPASYPHFRCVTPSWDNSARRKQDAYIVQNDEPSRYGSWLQEVIRRTLATNPQGERLVFINAWNEWAEGAHLEPDAKFGHRFLEETEKALRAATGKEDKTYALVADVRRAEAQEVR